MAKGKLRLAQEEHARRMTLLRIWLDEQGICYTEGDSFRDSRVHGEFGVKKGYGHPFSCHKLKLADDLNFEVATDHVRAHDKWDELGGAKRLLHDMNHYSSGWEKYI